MSPQPKSIANLHYWTVRCSENESESPVLLGSLFTLIVGYVASIPRFAHWFKAGVGTRDADPANLFQMS